MDEKQERKKRLKEIYGLSGRQSRSIERMMACYNMPEKAALLELSYREDFKNKRNDKLLKLFGKGERYEDFVSPPIIDLTQEEGPNGRVD